MSKRVVCLKVSFVLAASAGLFATCSHAANGVWTSAGAGSDAFWTNNANWSASPYPAGNQTALFNNSGNGRTTIDVSGLAYGVSNIVFDTFGVAPYTLGSGGPSQQALVFTNNSILRVSPTTVESQRIDATVLLGQDRTATTHTFRNDQPLGTLTLAGGMAVTNSGGTGGTKTVNVAGAGNTTISGNIVTNGYSPLTLTDTATGTLLLTGSNRVNTVNANGGAFIFSGTNWLGAVNVNAAGPLNFAGTNILAGQMTLAGTGNSVVNVTAGTLVFANGGNGNLVATQDAVINGPGDVVLSNNGGDFANNSVTLGRTLVINARLTGPSGFELYVNNSGTTNGTFVLNGINDFAQNVTFNSTHVLRVSKIGNKGSTTSNLGRGTTINVDGNNPGSALHYVGTGETTDRILNIATNFTLDHSGTGLLKFTGAHTASARVKTLTLQGSTDGIGEMASAIPVGSGTTTALAKNGTGTWLLTANHLYAGTTTVSGGTLSLTGAAGTINASTGYLLNGGTLLLDNTAAANNTNRLRDASAITLNGGTLLFSNDGGSATFLENAGALTVNLNASTVATVQAAPGQTATLRFASLSRNAGGTVNFTGEGLGLDTRNRIFITSGQAEGLIGPWATVNGTNLAAYSAANGVYAAADAAAYTDIAAYGDTIVSNDASLVRINTFGTSGDIALDSPVTRITALVQNTAYEATVATASKALQTAVVSVPAGKASVTVGAAANDGTLSPLFANGELALNNDSANDLTVNASITSSGATSTLTKYGSGSATLAAANAFTGTVAVLGGSLVLANTDALQYVTLDTPNANGIVFDSSVATHAFTVGNLTNVFTLALADNAANPVALTVGKNNAASAFAGTLTGAGSLTKTGNGTLTLSGTNSFTGGLTLAPGAGAVTATAVGALGLGPVVNDATLNLNARDVTYSGLSTSLSGAGTNNVLLGTGGNNTYLSGDYSGFTGLWNIGVNGSGGKAIMSGLDNAAATINVLSNATLFCAAATQHNATINLYGGNTGESIGQLRLDGGAVWAGPITVRGTLTDIADAYFGANTGNTGYYTGVIDDLGAGYTISIVGGGASVFSGPNTYLGPTWVKAGTLRVPNMGSVNGGASALGAPTNAAQGTVKLGRDGAGATLNYFGMGETTDRTIDLASNVGTIKLYFGGTNTWTLTADVISSGVGAKQLQLDGITNNVGVLAGVVNNTLSGHGVDLYKIGFNTWKLTRDNLFSGNVDVNQGILVITQSGSLGVSNKYVRILNGSIGNTQLHLDGSAGDIALGTNLTFYTSSAYEGALRNLAGQNSIAGNFYLQGGGGDTVVHSAAGKLTLSGQIEGDYNGARNLRLRGDGDGEVSGAIVNGSGSETVGVVRDVGTGTWTLSGSNTYTLATTASSGTLVVGGTNGSIAGPVTLSGTGTFVVANSDLLNHANRLGDAATVTLNGGTLSYSHTGGAANYSETAGPLVVNSASNVLLTSQADETQTSVLTFASLARNGSGAIDFRGTGLGVDDRNKVMFTAAPAAGLIGLWATYNSAGFAAYDDTLGVVAAGDSVFTDIPALGPYEITNNATLTARINDIGTAGPLALQGSPVSSLKSLLQNTNTASVVGMTNQTLLVSDLMIAAGKADLTLGTEQDEGLVMPLTAGGTLTLINQAESTLTLNAGVTNNTSASALVKLGLGTVKLNGRSSYTGTTLMENGTLEFGGTSTQTLGGVISGAGTLVKSGNGILTLSGGNTYTGPTTIKQGVVVAQNSAAFGSTVTGTVIEAGATLDAGGSLAVNALDMRNEVFTVSGDGVNGMGALVNNSNTQQYNAFHRITLADDVTFGGASRWDMRNTPVLTMNGFTITKVSTNFVNLSNATVYPDGAGGTGDIDVQAGSFGLDGAGTRLNGGAANTLTVRGGARLELYNVPIVTNAVPWSLILEHGSTVLATQGNGNGTVNTWGGPVTLNGAASLSANAGFSLTYPGELAGDGSVIKTGPGTVYLTGTNTYAGSTAVSNGTLYAKTAGSLPGTGTSRVTVTGGSTLLLPTGDGATTGWTYDQIRSLYDADTFNTNTATLAIDTTLASLEHPGDLAKPMALTKAGTNSLALQGVNTFNGALTVNGGEVTMTASGNHRLGNVTIGTASFVVSNAAAMHTYATNTFVGNAAAEFGRMTLAGNAVWGTVLPIQNTPSPTLYVGYNGRGVLTVLDNAVLTNKIILGYGTGSHGALYQRGNSLVHNWGGQGNDGRIGESGYGYYELSGGTMTNNGYFQLGVNPASVGILSQSGGSFRMSNKYGGAFAVSRGGTGVVYVAGGKFDSFLGINIGEFSGSGYVRGFAEFTVDGTGDATVAGNLNIADRTNMFATVNLDGGRLTANTFSKGLRAGSLALVNFDGGTFRARTAGNLFGVNANAPDGVYVYPGGATFDSTNLAVTANANLLAPAGNGVSGITITPRGGYIGPPFVTIAGGGGTGATAIASFDSANGTVTGVTITCPGYGYRTYPTVTLSGGGTNLQTAVTGVTLAPNTSGGLTKQGTSTLLLTGTNTYGGATTLAGGTLKPNNALAFPATTTFTFAGGTLDLNGLTLTNLINTSGAIAGGLTNGTLQTVLSPAGEGVVGSQTFSLAIRSSATLRGTYFADVTDAGASDLVAVQGEINLSNLALQIVNTDNLNRHQQYTILTCAGTRTGTFASDNLPDSRWHVLYVGDGTVKLAFIDGTLIKVR